MEDKMAHTCQALVITCMDYRFRSAIREFLISRGYQDDYDMVALAGATKDLIEGDDAGSKIIMKEIEISHRLHEVKKLVIIHHMDCGAYGGHAAFDSKEDEHDSQVKDMMKADEMIRAKHPDLVVELVLARIDETGDEPVIDFKMIQ